jgi:hypothetical protein
MGLESVCTSLHEPTQRTLLLRSSSITVELDLATERVLTIKEDRNLDRIYSLDGAMLEYQTIGHSGYQFVNHRGGNLMLDEYLGCHNCGKFGVSLVISIDAKTGRVSSVAAANENLSFDINDQPYLVKNNEMGTFISSGTNIVCPPLPLIPFNITNIQETIGRIKKLLVFT